MKKIISLFLTIISMVIFTGCGTFNINIEGPQNKTIIEGQWKAININLQGHEGEKDNSYKENILSFSQNEVLIFDKIYNNISYKAKVVNEDKYLYEVMGYIPDYISGKLNEIVVLTISSNNTFILDVIFIEERIYIIEDSILYELVQIDKKPLEIENILIEDKKDDGYYKIDSGVLIGLRHEDEYGNHYRTLWVKNKNGNISIDEIPFLLLPRKSGFFKVTNKRQYNKENYFKDIIVFEDMNGRIIEFHSDILEESSTYMNVAKGITFIGNDFMSVKTNKYNKNINEEVLSTYVLDLNTLEVNKPIPLGTLTDSTDISNVILEADKDNILKTKDINSFTNFAINRKQGRWNFYTTTENNESERQEPYYIESEESGKVDITLRVSEKITKHDSIFMPWQGIQKKVPSATDAISSPNKNLSIIKTKSKFYIYKIIDNKIDEESEVIVSLKDNESIVMAEWAEGDYVTYWSEYIEALEGK